MSSVSLCVTGIVHTVALSLPPVQRFIQALCTPANAAAAAAVAVKATR